MNLSVSRYFGRQRFDLKLAYFLFIFLIWIGGATKFTESDLILQFTFFFSWALFVFKVKRRVSRNVIVLLTIFFLINILSVLFNGFELSINAFIGYNMRVLTAYFAFSYLGSDFFRFFRKGMLFMTLISLPFYLVQLVMGPRFYIDNFSFINLSGELRSSVEYWNFLLYTTHSSSSDFGIRNDGFAVEPGHFGGLIIMALLFELLKNNFKFSRYVIVIGAIGLTTFSTTYYLAILILLLLIMLNNNRLKQIVIFIFPIFLFLTIWLINSSIIVDKIEKTSYYNRVVFGNSRSTAETGDILDRFSAFEIGVENFINYPLGYGLNSAGKLKALDGTVLVGPNVLIDFILIWGCIALLYIPLLLYRFWKNYQPSISNLTAFLLVLIVLMLMFSTSLQSRDYILFIMFLIGLMKFNKTEMNYR